MPSSFVEDPGPSGARVSPGTSAEIWDPCQPGLWSRVCPLLVPTHGCPGGRCQAARLPTPHVSRVEGRAESASGRLPSCPAAVGLPRTAPAAGGYAVLPTGPSAAASWDLDSEGPAQTHWEAMPEAFRKDFAKPQRPPTDELRAVTGCQATAPPQAPAGTLVQCWSGQGAGGQGAAQAAPRALVSWFS